MRHSFSDCPCRRVIANCFDPSVVAAAKAVRAQLRGRTDAVSAFMPLLRCHHGINWPWALQHVFLTGGFGASPWLFAQLKQRLGPLGKNMKNDDSSRYVGVYPGRCPHFSSTFDSGKAVAHGAIAFHLDRFVKARAAKYTLGIEIDPDFNPLDRQHTQRRHLVYNCPVSGKDRLRGGFFTLVSKV